MDWENKNKHSFETNRSVFIVDRCDCDCDCDTDTDLSYVYAKLDAKR